MHFHHQLPKYAATSEKFLNLLRLRSMGPGASDIAAIIPDLRDKLPNLELPPDLEPEQARFRLFDSITTFFRNSARSQSLVIILDDLHWADSASLLLLEFVAREMADCQLLMVGTYRDVELSRSHPLSETLGGLARERLFQRIPLRGLDPKDLELLIEATAGIALSASFAAAVQVWHYFCTTSLFRPQSSPKNRKSRRRSLACIMSIRVSKRNLVIGSPSPVRMDSVTPLNTQRFS